MKVSWVCTAIRMCLGKNIFERVNIPRQSYVNAFVSKATFYDSYTVKMKELKPQYRDLSPDSLSFVMFQSTPKWIDNLMVMRNRIVSSLFGLKDLGSLSNIDMNKPISSYKIGDRMGIFTLLHRDEKEIVFGDHDKHLEVKVSVCKYQEQDEKDGNLEEYVCTSTLVQNHNMLGACYMLFVKPIHRIIAPVMLAHLCQTTTASS